MKPLRQIVWFLLTLTLCSEWPGRAQEGPAVAIREAGNASTTGDPGNPLVFPLNAVRWLTLPRDFAALVSESSQVAFSAQLYHFGSAPRPLSAELFLLNPGDYRLTLANKTEVPGKPLLQMSLRVEGPRTRFAVELPPRTLCDLRVERSQPGK